MRLFLLCLLALASIPACVTKDLDSGMQSAMAKSSIDSLWTSYALASDQRDAIGFEALFTEDAALVVTEVPTARGRQAIGECLKAIYDKIDATGLRVVPEELRVSGTLAAQAGTFEESFLEEEKPRVRYGRYALVAERVQDSAWRIRRLTALADSIRP